MFLGLIYYCIRRHYYHSEPIVRRITEHNYIVVIDANIPLMML